MPLNLDKHLVLDARIPKAPNLTHLFEEGDLTSIGEWIWEGYRADEVSCQPWRERTQAALDLAMQVAKAKTFPWDNCANVTFPLVTIAALQFHARSYPPLVSGRDPVKCRLPAPDPKGELAERSYRVGCYMSYQILEEDEPWEEGHDRLLIILPIVGCVFKKTRYDSAKGHPATDLVSAGDLVMNYYAKSVDSCPRKTQILTLSKNEVWERCAAKSWRDVREEEWFKAGASVFRRPSADDEDARKGHTPPAKDDATPFTFLEQHVSIDLDKDGYAEPYIVTIEADTHCVVRIVARWEDPADVAQDAKGSVLRIQPSEFYTKYDLIPSPDNGIYGVGFGFLLGPLNESVNSIVNMLLDAGTLATAAGGFLSRGVKIRGGKFEFNPFEWNRVDSTGDDLRKGIVELPVREPSTVLFQLLSFLVNYTQRIAGATDALAGENPGQNTPAQTQQSMVEQGLMIYSATFKRVWRSMKDEFKKRYILNARHLPFSKPFGAGTIAREDFLGDPSQVVPAADPNVTSEQKRILLANTIAERARMVPGYAPGEAERRLLMAMQVDGIETLFPGPAALPPPVDPKVALEQLKQEGAQALQQAEFKFEMLKFAATLQEEARVNNAQIDLFIAQAEKFKADAATEDSGKVIAMIDAMIGATKQRNESIQLRVDSIMRALEHQANVRELDIRAHEAQTKRIAANKPAPAAA